METLVDAFSTSRVYIPALFIINKIDKAKKKKVPGENYIALSAEKGLGLDELREEIWKILKLVKVYLVRPDDKPNLESPIIMKEGETLKDVAEKIGSEFAESKRLAKIWGPGAHYPGQEVSLSLPVREGMQVRFI